MRAAQVLPPSAFQPPRQCGALPSGAASLQRPAPGNSLKLARDRDAPNRKRAPHGRVATVPPARGSKRTFPAHAVTREGRIIVLSRRGSPSEPHPGHRGNGFARRLRHPIAVICSNALPPVRSHRQALRGRNAREARAVRPVLDPYTSLAIAIAALMLGSVLNRSVPWLRRYSIADTNNIRSIMEITMASAPFGRRSGERGRKLDSVDRVPGRLRGLRSPPHRLRLLRDASLAVAKVRAELMVSSRAGRSCG